MSKRIMCTDVGVIVGRFQVPELHAGHRHLIDTVASFHDDICIVLGTTIAVLKPQDALPANVRRVMIARHYPNATILELPDQGSDTAWSTLLDELLAASFPERGIVLYGSRDSFIPHYKGCFRTVEVPERMGENGTAHRARAANTILDSADFRAGVLWAAENRRRLVHPTVDIAILDPSTRKVLLGRRRKEGGFFRFFGGFVDPEDASIEAAARREAREEAGEHLEIGPFVFLDTARIDDHRYRGTGDAVMTSFFKTERLAGFPEAGDDIDFVDWLPYAEVSRRLVPAHAPLGEIFDRLVRDAP